MGTIRRLERVAEREDRQGPIPSAPRRLSTTATSGFRPAVRPRPVLLIADREPASLLAACRHLEQAGFAVRRASSGEETRALLEREMPDLLILDAGLPDGDGFALCRAVRETPAGRETPIIVSTDTEDYESLVRSHDAGATDFAPRPINWLVLPLRHPHLLEIQRARRGLRLTNSILRDAERVACLATWRHDSQTGGLEWSAEAGRLFGPPEALPASGKAFLDVVHPDDRAFVEAEIESSAREGAPFGAEHRIRRSDGGGIRFVRHWAEFDLGEDGEPVWVKGILQDVTDQIRAEEQIWNLSNMDRLTGLPNRSMLQHLLEQTLARSARSGRLVATLFLDIDRFEEINETYGPEVGDRLIVQVAERLQKTLRKGDTVAHVTPFQRTESLARLSGDEFVVLLSDVENAEGIAHVARRILDAASDAYVLGQTEIFVSLSIGIAVSPPDGSEPGLLIQHAETALKEAKKQGRGSFRFYTDALNAFVARKLEMETCLHRALERGELSLHYQPLVGGRNRKVFGFEALLRWSSPELGEVPPARFIPVAEESGLIFPVGEWVLRTACAQAATWSRAGLAPLTAAVNVSSLQLARPDFPDTVFSILRETGLPAGHLLLEITESCLLSGDPETQSRLQRLRAAGVRLVIDDFGMGYSALRYLKSLPVDALKIDRTFVEGIAPDSGDAAIVSALISMSRSLKLDVLAEGVETEAQLRFLCERECDQAQGFLFSRPLPAESFEEYLHLHGLRTDGSASV
ncbi:MAG TPA: EAL domain-containing protein [Thermoanaerobaculia bacterium]|nr:EAL domain-containing protein [Thermoanaerobaculia bacterium]